MEPSAIVIDDQVVEQINAAAAQARRHAEAACQHAVQAGQLLLRAKEQVPHGQWEDWVAANCSFAARTARAYMRLAASLAALPAPERQRVADMPLRQAIAAITTPAAEPAVERYRPSLPLAARARPVLERCCSSVRSLASHLGRRTIKRDRLQSVRAQLLSALAEVDGILEDAGRREVQP